MESEQLKLIDVIEQLCIQKNISLEPMRVAQDVMNPNVRTLTLDHTVNHCLELMKNLSIRHVAVVDQPIEEEKKPYFIGIVSQRDVLRISAPDAKKTGKQKMNRTALRQLLGNIVARKPKSVSPQTPIQEVITTMTCNHIDMVPVLDDADLVGFITTTDLMKIFFKLDKVIHQLCPELKKGTLPADMACENSAKDKILFSWVSRTIQEIMTKQVVCLEPQDNLARAIEVMQTETIRHIPVIDEQAKFVGLVSDRDILRNLSFAGKRPPSLPKRFREHLFTAKSDPDSLQLFIESIMVRKALQYIPPSCSVCEAADILNKKRVSCLPVIDEQEKLRGIVTITDLMQALLAIYQPLEEAGLILSESSVC